MQRLTQGSPSTAQEIPLYTWIWRRLPGNTLVKTLAAVILVVAVSALLLFVVFPQIEPLMPFGIVTVTP